MKRPKDHELLIISRIADLLATLDKRGRHRVVAYLAERLESLPGVIAEVGNSEPATPEQPFMFPDRERRTAAKQGSVS